MRGHDILDAPTQISDLMDDEMEGSVLRAVRDGQLPAGAILCIGAATETYGGPPTWSTRQRSRSTRSSYYMQERRIATSIPRVRPICRHVCMPPDGGSIGPGLRCSIGPGP